MLFRSLTIVVLIEGKEKSGGAKVIVVATPYQSIVVTTIVAKLNFLQYTSTYFFKSIMEIQNDNFGIKNGVDSKCMKTILLFILKFFYHFS